MSAIMLALTLAWAARRMTQPCASTTRTGTVRCDHHNNDDPVGDNFSTLPALHAVSLTARHKWRGRDSLRREDAGHRAAI
eukprot:949409-Prymnesium_polylepis.1